MAAVAPPSSVAEALEMLRAGMGYMAAVDAAELPAAVQSECLQAFEQVDAMGMAARSWILAAFAAAGGYSADADANARMWLVNRTGVTKGCAAGHVGWSRRTVTHPRVVAAMGAAQISVSVAREMCRRNDRLPEPSRDTADEILLNAARGGLGLRDLMALAERMYEESRSKDPDGDDDPGRVLEDRSVRLETTLGGAGVLNGDLTPECAASVQAVLDALSARAGAEDTRSHDQRYHDALQEAMRRLLASDLLPDRAGQPARIWAHIPLIDLIDLDTGRVLQKEWTARVRAQWAAARAAASVAGGDGAAWLDGGAAAGFACDASVTPVVTGEVNPAALEDIVRLCVELAGYGPVPPTGRGREALEYAIIGKAIQLVSGPGGLASFLRRRQLGGRLGGPSLPLDVGFSNGVPAGIRTAVRLRDQHCRWPGGCWQPAGACHVHHVTHKARGGKTSVRDCVLLCSFHHLIVIHEWGWTLVLNADGTTTARNRDNTKVLHSHGPPARAG